MLNGCQSNAVQSNKLADYRATIISSMLPKKLGPITLVKAKAELNNVILVFTKETYVDMSKLLEGVTTDYCSRLETRHLLNNGLIYQIVMLDPENKIEFIGVISLDKCSS
ncbi:type II secretion system pilot lipoprotein GspS-beta [Vibrio sp. 99-8-1]|uniref:type II secretion system pilot lipoprotein GspS-beta n=1 Tax=Vibrio sp. 99-8-1 TaxID=2607602 RepID=UPI0016A82F41|nr:type II secretion system pilot lipoprotein GspS-beta [Vibrio sp. 99-8-1]NOI65065.1 hypothetical protein [Vibrio sp. 99-8-1]